MGPHYNVEILQDSTIQRAASIMNFLQFRWLRAYILLWAIIPWGAASTVLATVPSQFTKQPASWYRTEEGIRIANNVLSWQTPTGSWPKNQDTASQPFDGDKEKLDGTFDNGATTGELAFLAKALDAAGDALVREGFLRGLDLLLSSQYPTGGWPQRVPLRRDYSRHITFNDGTMVRILELLRSVSNSPAYRFVDQERRTRSLLAFDRGIECILRCQVVVNEKRTVWCAQHDEIDLRPRAARKYELESLSGAESVGILKLLMSIDHPSREIQRSIRDGVAWFRSSKMTASQWNEIAGDGTHPLQSDREPVWARFYEIDSNRPFFCGRDGIKKFQLSEIEEERRTGYSWSGTWGKDLDRLYDQYSKKWGTLEDAHN